MVKNPPANAGDIGDASSIPGSGRSSGVGHCNTLKYFCLENSMDRGAWWGYNAWGRRGGHNRACAHQHGW